MTFEEVHKKHEEELKMADELYATNQINSLELAALKDQIDSEYRRDLSQAK